MCLPCSTCGLRIKNAVMWTMAMAVVLGLAIGCAYGKHQQAGLLGQVQHLPVAAELHQVRRGQTHDTISCLVACLLNQTPNQAAC
jgi:hypothetical protein